MKQTILLLMIVLFFQTIQTTAQTLTAGDIVIIGLSADGPDEFSWVPLVDLTAGTEIYFSDVGCSTALGDWMGSSYNSNVEWLMKFTVPAGGLSAGAVQTVIAGSEGSNYTFYSGTKFDYGFTVTSINLNTSGDQIIIFQSTDAIGAGFGNTNFTPIFHVTSSTTNWAAYTNTSSSAFTNLSPGLIDGINAVAAGAGVGVGDEYDNIRYAGGTTGDKATILAAVADVNNWTGVDNPSPASGYTANGVASFSVLPVELTFFDGITKDNTVALTWQTATEEINEGFEIERGQESGVRGQIAWEVIGFVAGAGTTVEV